MTEAIMAATPDQRNTTAIRIARRDPEGFAIVASDGKWMEAPHLDRINDALLKIVNGEISRLMVLLPPRHGKSEFLSKYFPAWYLGMNPDKRIILTSYEADFAAQWGRRTRDLLEEHGPRLFPEPVKLNPDSSSASRWDIAGHSGGMMTAGIRGPVTGKGMDIGILDDPVKNAEDAASKTLQDHNWEWYQSTFYTRLEPDGAIILIQTRWNENDLAGKLLAEMKTGGEQWAVLSLPALAEENDPLGRPVGTPLWPERFPVSALERIRTTAGSYFWNALYQQRPSPEEGEIFHRGWWRFYRVQPWDIGHFDEMIQSWDCAFKDTKSSDYVVGQVWGRIGSARYLLDQVRGRMDFPATIMAVLSLSTKWQRARRKLIEDKANGPAVIQQLKTRVSGLIPVEPEGGKIVRARASTAEIEAGNVYLPDPSITPWIHDYIEEFAAFPTGRNDDQVDATTQAMIYFNAHSWEEIPIEEATSNGGGVPGFDDEVFGL